MTPQQTRRGADRGRAGRPATVTLAQKSLTEWYAEWKARRAVAPGGPPPAAAGTPGAAGHEGAGATDGR